jgi:GTP-binding protein
VLVGRPNVGKSTLFNRLTRSRRAIVTAIPGTTRDVIAQRVDWQGAHFELTDTGGMFGASEDPLHALVLERGRRAIADADLLVFVVDGREGLVPGDAEIARIVREADTPALLAINKTDDKRARAGAIEFFQLGLEPVFEISAEHGEGVGDLLDAIVERAGRMQPESEIEDEADDHKRDGHGVALKANRDPLAETSVAIIGRPNAGKSSLVNRLLREERMIVSEMPGTTRDAVDTLMTWHRRQFRIVDTAGIRRPGRVARSGQLESVSVLLSRRSIEDADIVALIVDASQGATDQDATIVGEADRLGKGVIIVANKWDLMKDRGPDFVKEFDETLRRQLKFLDYAPVLHISAQTGERAPKLLEMIDQVSISRRQRVKTGDLNRFVERITAEHPPVSPGSRHVRVMYAAQTNVAPPTFVFFTNIATSFHFSYLRYLENRIREEFGFMGTPIRIQVRARRRTEAEAEGDTAKGPRGGGTRRTRTSTGAGAKAGAPGGVKKKRVPGPRPGKRTVRPGQSRHAGAGPKSRPGAKRAGKKR